MGHRDRSRNSDTDPGIATTKEDYSLGTYILSTNHYQIELLTNLDQVPESGAIAGGQLTESRDTNEGNP